MLQGVGKIPAANVLQLSSSASAKRSSAVFAARQTKQGEQEHGLVQALAAGEDEEDVHFILFTSSNLVRKETK